MLATDSHLYPGTLNHVLSLGPASLPEAVGCPVLRPEPYRTLPGTPLALSSQVCGLLLNTQPSFSGRGLRCNWAPIKMGCWGHVNLALNSHSLQISLFPLSPAQSGNKTHIYLRNCPKTDFLNLNENNHKPQRLRHISAALVTCVPAACDGEPGQDCLGRV